MQNKALFEQVRKASHTLPLLSDDTRNRLLATLADRIEAESPSTTASCSPPSG